MLLLMNRTMNSFLYPALTRILMVRGEDVYDIVIVGGGPAGLAAAIHSAVFGLRTLVLEADKSVGGIATRARGLNNCPGFLKISGLRLMEKMAVQARKSGAELRTSEEVVNLSLRGKDKTVETKLEEYEGKALILATGDGMNGIGMKWETWIGGGVAYCTECGACFFNGRETIVVGNTKEAVDEALLLTKIASNVTLVNHCNTIDLDAQTRKQLEKQHVGLIEDFMGKEIKGNPPFKRLVLHHINGSETRILNANIVLVVAGVKPFVSILRNAGIRTHRRGCIIVDELGKTNVAGVFAAGGCASTLKDLIPACVGDGTTVATCARLYLAYER
jgi:thioredoxin reductase (NADPH)